MGTLHYSFNSTTVVYCRTWVTRSALDIRYTIIVDEQRLLNNKLTLNNKTQKVKFTFVLRIITKLIIILEWISYSVCCLWRVVNTGYYTGYLGLQLCVSNQKFHQNIRRTVTSDRTPSCAPFSQKAC